MVHESSPDEARIATGLLIDLIEFLFDNGPRIEWPTCESTTELSFNELIDKCQRTMQDRVANNIKATDWTPAGGPPESLVRTLAEVEGNDRIGFVKEFVAEAIIVEERESLDNAALAWRMLPLIRAALITAVLAVAVYEHQPARVWPVSAAVADERGYPLPPYYHDAHGYSHDSQSQGSP